MVMPSSLVNKLVHCNIQRWNYVFLLLIMVNVVFLLSPWAYLKWTGEVQVLIDQNRLTALQHQHQQWQERAHQLPERQIQSEVIEHIQQYILSAPVRKLQSEYISSEQLLDVQFVSSFSVVSDVISHLILHFPYLIINELSIKRHTEIGTKARASTSEETPLTVTLKITRVNENIKGRVSVRAKN